MTILTKSQLLSKPVVVDLNTEDNEGGDEKVLCIEPRAARLPPRSGGAVLCLAIIALLVASAGFMCGLELYREYMRTGGHRYTGFCAIPVPLDDKPNYMPVTFNSPSLLQWSSSPDADVDRELGDREPADDDYRRFLREELEIKDEVEKITVINGLNGHQVGFLHDFSGNVTGIIDDERCFVMDLNPNFVLQPSAFVMTIEGNGEFDVSSVRNTMRALLPPLLDLMRVSKHLSEKCAHRPAYRLQADDVTIRKRSTEDARAADFTHFSGRHVQQIVIDNLPELRQLEDKLRK